MARCRCEQGTCGCAVIPGDGITIDGAGTPRDPWVITSTATAYALNSADSASVDMSVTGVGTVAMPWTVSASAIIDPLIDFDPASFTVTGAGSEASPMHVSLADGAGGGGTNVSFSDTTEIVFTEAGAGTVDDPLVVSAEIPLIIFTGGTPGDVLTMDAAGVFYPGPPTQAPAGSVALGFGLTGDGSGANPVRIDICTYDQLKAACAP